MQEIKKNIQLKNKSFFVLFLHAFFLMILKFTLKFYIHRIVAFLLRIACPFFNTKNIEIKIDIFKEYHQYFSPFYTNFYKIEQFLTWLFTI